MSKTYKKLRLTIGASSAKPTPPVGPMLGQRGLNIKEFCSLFNNLSQKYVETTPLTTDLIIEKGNTVKIEIYGTTLNYLLKNMSKDNELSINNLYNISKYLQKNDNRYKNKNIEAIFKSVLSSCNTIKIKIK